MKNIYFALVESTALLAFAETTEDQVAQIEARMAETKARLNLTDEQAERLEPVFWDSREKRLALMAKHGITRDSRSSGKDWNPSISCCQKRHGQKK